MEPTPSMAVSATFHFASDQAKSLILIAFARGLNIATTEAKNSM